MIYCNISECKYNYGKTCRKKTIYLGWKVSNEFNCGERMRFPVCEDFKETEEEHELA